MAASRPSSVTSLTTADLDPTAPLTRRAARFLLRVLEELGHHPSVWDPWLLLTLYRATQRPNGDR